MKTAGIICEYNPFHNGHAYMISELRSRGYDRIICLMSGSTVQRGDFAILPPRCRAAMAVSGGADAVFCLPFPWCSGSAEFFAGAGVGILHRLGVDAVAFGTESGLLPDISEIKKAKAGMCLCSRGTGTAEAYFSGFRNRQEGSPAPNDILAAEYAAAADRLGIKIVFEPVKRLGSGFSDEKMPQDPGCFPSAAAIRKLMTEGIQPGGLPEASLSLINDAASAGECPVTAENIALAILSFWRLAPSEETSRFAECGGGVAERLRSAAAASASLDEFFRRAATKKYTNARLRRAALFGIAGVMPDDLKAAPAYTVLLAANAAGCAFVKEAAKKGGIPIVSKNARLPDDEGSRRQAELSRRIDSLFTLALPLPCESGKYFRQSPLIISEDK